MVRIIATASAFAGEHVHGLIRDDRGDGVDCFGLRDKRHVSTTQLDLLV